MLKPAGKFVFEEVTAQWITRWPNSAVFLHPGDRFAAKDFLREVEANRLVVGGNHVERKRGDFVFGVGVKAAG